MMKTDQPTHNVVAGGGSLWHMVGSAYMERDGSLRVFLDQPAIDGAFRIEPIRRTLWQRLARRFGKNEGAGSA